jgi:hypothetical protein
VTGGRPRLPAAEARLVRDAAASIDLAGPREPIARAIAARVTDHLRVFAAEASDPMVAAVGLLGRAVLHSPIIELATDPDIDTLAMFVEARVKSLRDRNGWPLTADQDRRDVDDAFQCVKRKLQARYLKILRS